MLQQFMNVHSSYLNPIKNKSLYEIYNIFKTLEFKKKNDKFIKHSYLICI